MTQHTFEIPQQFRDLAEKNVEQARAAYGQLMDGMTQSLGLWSTATSSDAVTSAFKVVQEGATRFAKENAEAGFALAKDLANAKDIKEVLALQSRYVQAQMQSFAIQAQELGRLMVEAAQSLKPRH